MQKVADGVRAVRVGLASRINAVDIVVVDRLGFVLCASAHAGESRGLRELEEENMRRGLTGKVGWTRSGSNGVAGSKVSGGLDASANDVPSPGARRSTLRSFCSPHSRPKGKYEDFKKRDGK
jgi:hypothetical protein